MRMKNVIEQEELTQATRAPINLSRWGWRFSAFVDKFKNNKISIKKNVIGSILYIL